MSKIKIAIQRAYDAPAEEEESFRVLVDRLWPRGLKKENLELDFWAKDISPSAEVRKKYHSHPDDFAAFKKSYLKELESNPNLDFLTKELGKHKRIILLYASKDKEHNNAVVLKEFLEKKMG
ncbi:protein of unknown function DUF488 [Pseudopedobacter saltans DSM 12145]|uniref:DUF488 domain-containing protein n=1 Tax=Pseudopedobacter saltans (strain ATCC 51119 / DSM 12145 / JCM 21818 / CCUG 39354 / LMG 10337 / NBRC 100064 / NCIMB 13643) TaxID=762903 RepID=F0SCW0_PSESL|nr:DUF488 family protein [Pseudopedobacter saltans]ADY50699.1 protein of unknown function DUF488 [Pseudopedobacter saltans DSM 12145]